MKPWPLFSFTALALLGCLWGYTGIDDLADGDATKVASAVSDWETKIYENNDDF